MSTILPHMVWPECEFTMQFWNVQHAARLKYRTQKIAKISPSRHHRTILSGCIFTSKAHIDNRRKPVKQQYLLNMSSQYGELRPTNGWDLLASLGYPCKFQRVSRLSSVTAVHGTLVLGVSQTLQRWTEDATYIWQGGHHVGHWPTFLVFTKFLKLSNYTLSQPLDSLIKLLYKCTVLPDHRISCLSQICTILWYDSI